MPNLSGLRNHTRKEYGKQIIKDSRSRHQSYRARALKLSPDRNSAKSLGNHPITLNFWFHPLQQSLNPPSPLVFRFQSQANRCQAHAKTHSLPIFVHQNYPGHFEAFHDKPSAEIQAVLVTVSPALLVKFVKLPDHEGCPKCSRAMKDYLKLYSSWTYIEDQTTQVHIRLRIIDAIYMIQKVDRDKAAHDLQEGWLWSKTQMAKRYIYNLVIASAREETGSTNSTTNKLRRSRFYQF